VTCPSPKDPVENFMEYPFFNQPQEVFLMVLGESWDSGIARGTLKPWNQSSVLVREDKQQGGTRISPRQHNRESLAVRPSGVCHGFSLAHCSLPVRTLIRQVSAKNHPGGDVYCKTQIRGLHKSPLGRRRQMKRCSPSSFLDGKVMSRLEISLSASKACLFPSAAKNK